jgi:hypothetical protein
MLRPSARSAFARAETAIVADSLSFAMLGDGVKASRVVETVTSGYLRVE